MLRRAGHTEAAVDLAALAGMTPAGVISEIVNDDGSMARLPRLLEFAAEHDLAIVSIADLVAYRRRHETQSNASPKRGCPPFMANGVRSGTAACSTAPR